MQDFFRQRYHMCMTRNGGLWNFGIISSAKYWEGTEFEYFAVLKLPIFITFHLNMKFFLVFWSFLVNFCEMPHIFPYKFPISGSSWVSEVLYFWPTKTNKADFNKWPWHFGYGWSPLSFSQLRSTSTLNPKDGELTPFSHHLAPFEGAGM